MKVTIHKSVPSDHPIYSIGAVVGGVLLIGQAVPLAREHRGHLGLGQRRLHPHWLEDQRGSELGLEHPKPKPSDGCARTSFKAEASNQT